MPTDDNLPRFMQSSSVPDIIFCFMLLQVTASPMSQVASPAAKAPSAELDAIAAAPQTQSPGHGADAASPYTDRTAARPLLDSPVAAAPTPEDLRACVAMAPLAAGLLEATPEPREATPEATPEAAGQQEAALQDAVTAEDEEKELPAVSRREAVPPVAAVSARPAAEAGEMELAGESQFVSSPAVPAPVLQPAAEQPAAPPAPKVSRLAAIKATLGLTSPPKAEAPASAAKAATPPKQSPPPPVATKAASPPPAASPDSPFSEPAAQDSGAVLAAPAAAHTLQRSPEMKQRRPPPPASRQQLFEPVTLSPGHRRGSSRLSEEGSPAKSPTPHDPKFLASVVKAANDEQPQRAQLEERRRSWGRGEQLGPSEREVQLERELALERQRRERETRERSGSLGDESSPGRRVRIQDAVRQCPTCRHGMAAASHRCSCSDQPDVPVCPWKGKVGSDCLFARYFSGSLRLTSP